MQQPISAPDLLHQLFLFNKSLVGEIRLNPSSSEADQITMPLFLVVEPAVSVGLISIAIETCLNQEESSFNRNTPHILIGLFSQIWDILRNSASLFSTDMVINCRLGTLISCSKGSSHHNLGDTFATSPIFQSNFFFLNKECQ